MYLSTRSLAAAGRREASEAEVEPSTQTGHERNVWYLGLTSMFTDVSSEMVASILPLYLTLFLGFGPLQLGLFDGAYQALTAIAAIAAAIGADRSRRHKLMAGAGYVISGLCTLGLVVTRGAWATTVGLLYLTRLGKGIRTAPRDALISLSVAPGRLGRAFGVHRAFDTVGAVTGPVAASLLLARDAAGYTTVFAVGFFVAVIGVAVFVLFVESVGPRRRGERGRHRLRIGRLGPKVATALRHRRFRLVLVAGLSLAVVRPGDGLVFLAFQRDSPVSTVQFPLLFSAASVTFLLAAAPFGVLADRIGRLRVFVIGEAALAGALAVVASGARGTGALVTMLALVGISYAATDGVLVAMASAALPERWRTTGLAVVAAVIAVGRFAASTGFGAVWERFGSTAAATVYMVGTLLVVALGVALAWREGPGPDEPDRTVMVPPDPARTLEAA
jgi:MFS family permease